MHEPKQHDDNEKGRTQRAHNQHITPPQYDEESEEVNDFYSPFASAQSLFGQRTSPLSKPIPAYMGMPTLGRPIPAYMGMPDLSRLQGGQQPQVQAKLKVDAPYTPHEQEADNLAEQIVNGSATSSSVSPTVTPVQASGEGAVEVPDAVAAGIQSTQGQGVKVPDHLAQISADALGQGIMDVRLHTDPRAADMAQSINAKAFTSGNDVYFNTGEYNPHTPEGQKLIAHELVHTQQQGGVKRMVQRSAAYATNGQFSVTHVLTVGPNGITHAYTIRIVPGTESLPLQFTVIDMINGQPSTPRPANTNELALFRRQLYNAGYDTPTASERARGINTGAFKGAQSWNATSGRFSRGLSLLSHAFTTGAAFTIRTRTTNTFTYLTVTPQFGTGTAAGGAGVSFNPFSAFVTKGSTEWDDAVDELKKLASTANSIGTKVSILPTTNLSYNVTFSENGNLDRPCPDLSTSGFPWTNADDTTPTSMTYGELLQQRLITINLMIDDIDISSEGLTKARTKALFNVLSPRRESFGRSEIGYAASFPGARGPLQGWWVTENQHTEQRQNDVFNPTTYLNSIIGTPDVDTPLARRFIAVGTVARPPAVGAESQPTSITFFP
ncbi:MAG: DUF4157 domain-containing protein [Cytophagales bacterium]|nr:DUF4157 domain-containing protein [Cytophagales bacterium]